MIISGPATRILMTFIYKTNFNHTALLTDFDASVRGDSWWASVQHGLALLGMCAPLSAIHDVRHVFIASSVTKDPTFNPGKPWGSHQLIDGNVAWADVKAVHDGANWSRQEKIRHEIKPYLENTGNYPAIIVCNEPFRGDVFNCGRCEKCSRTTSALPWIASTLVNAASI